MAEAQPPLSWETSASSQPSASDRLPDEVVTCLQNSRFVQSPNNPTSNDHSTNTSTRQLHLATCTANFPHVSLMNYTYLGPQTRPSASNTTTSSHLPAGPMVIMTSNPSSKKTLNLLQNPNVSLLVHDWVSSRPPHISGGERSPTAARSSSLATMLMQMNSAAVSSISATMNGEARVLEPGTAEEKWCREQHLANNTFEEQAGGGEDGVTLGTSPGVAGDGGRGSYIEDEDVRVVVVRITGGRISDWKGGVKDWVIREGGEVEGRDGLVNGVPPD